ncbi:MAG: response regulator [Cyclobacteriaceae bacterium]
MISGIKNENAYEVLIVEDEENVANLLSEHLRNTGFMVALADTVSMAREGLYEMSPDIVFLDIHLPDGLGLDLIPFLRRNHDCKIVAMSSDEQYMKKAVEGDSHADVFLPKPFKINTIDKTLAYLEQLQD